MKNIFKNSDMVSSHIFIQPIKNFCKILEKEFFDQNFG